MQESLPQNISLEQYLALKKEVSTLYEKMMEMHFENRRDASYANARAAYMEKRNLLQLVLVEHPEYEGSSS